LYDGGYGKWGAVWRWDFYSVCVILGYMKTQRIKAIAAAVIFVVSANNIYAGDPWADFFGTSSTAGTWNSGTRTGVNKSIEPPFVIRWERFAWAGSEINVVGHFNTALVYDGYVYLGQGDSSNLNDPGYIWAWDVATGVTKTGYPIGPLDSGVDSFGMAIANDRLYALTHHNLYGWDISTTPPTIISGFPVSITETTDGGTNVVYPGGVICWNDKLFF